MTKPHIDIVFSGQMPDLAFVEAEIHGHSVCVGTWCSDERGLQILRIPAQTILERYHEVAASLRRQEGLPAARRWPQETRLGEEMADTYCRRTIRDGMMPKEYFDEVLRGMKCDGDFKRVACYVAYLFRLDERGIVVA